MSDQVCASCRFIQTSIRQEGALRADGAGNPRVYERKDGLGWAASFEVVASSVKFLSGKDEPADQEIAF